MKKNHSLLFLSGVVSVLYLLSGCSQKVDNFTRGVGIYPGDPAEDFSPALVTDNENYRNLARLRPAWNSSSYDYNLTAQLVTDGIITDNNYVSLIPGEEKVIIMKLFDKDTIGEKPYIEISGLNI
jgi:hypothetical protein